MGSKIWNLPKCVYDWLMSLDLVIFYVPDDLLGPKCDLMCLLLENSIAHEIQLHKCELLDFMCYICLIIG